MEPKFDIFFVTAQAKNCMAVFPALFLALHRRNSMILSFLTEIETYF